MEQPGFLLTLRESAARLGLSFTGKVWKFTAFRKSDVEWPAALRATPGMLRFARIKSLSPSLLQTLSAAPEK
jgi:hypothetical protein